MGWKSAGVQEWLLHQEPPVRQHAIRHEERRRQQRLQLGPAVEQQPGRRLGPPRVPAVHPVRQPVHQDLVQDERRCLPQLLKQQDLHQLEGRGLPQTVRVRVPGLGRAGRSRHRQRIRQPLQLRHQPLPQRWLRVLQRRQQEQEPWLGQPPRLLQHPRQQRRGRGLRRRVRKDHRNLVPHQVIGTVATDLLFWDFIVSDYHFWDFFVSDFLFWDFLFGIFPFGFSFFDIFSRTFSFL